jgi:Protein of unknown function (DUF2950)
MRIQYLQRTLRAVLIYTLALAMSPQGLYASRYQNPPPAGEPAPPPPPDQPQAPPPNQPQPARILKAQGAHAPGGARSYIVDGKMTRGFAFLAYPAEYRSSGVMTFIVNQDGVVYQKDLGPQTGEIAKSLTQYDRDASWHQAE